MSATAFHTVPTSLRYVTLSEYQFSFRSFFGQLFFHDDTNGKRQRMIKRFVFLLISQVLVSFSEDTDNEADGSIYAESGSNNVPNMYSSMDTIHMETF